MKPVKLTYTHQELQRLNAIWETQIKWNHTDSHIMTRSIIEGLAEKFLKKAIERKKNHTFTLKPHEAIALKIFIGAIMNNFLDDLRTFNMLQMDFNLLHQKSI